MNNDNTQHIIENPQNNITKSIEQMISLVSQNKRSIVYIDKSSDQQLQFIQLYDNEFMPTNEAMTLLYHEGADKESYIVVYIKWCNKKLSNPDNANIKFIMNNIQSTTYNIQNEDIKLKMPIISQYIYYIDNYINAVLRTSGNLKNIDQYKTKLSHIFSQISIQMHSVTAVMKQYGALHWITGPKKIMIDKTCIIQSIEQVIQKAIQDQSPESNIEIDLQNLSKISQKVLTQFTKITK